MQDDEAQRMLRREPMLFNYFIDIKEGQVPWKSYEAKLDSALALLLDDEPYSLCRMAPPPSVFDPASPSGVRRKEVLDEWKAKNPNHPWARSCAHNNSLLRHVDAMRNGDPLDGNPFQDSDPFREARRAGEEVLVWGFLVPEAFTESRLSALSSVLLHWDAGINYDLVRAAYFLNARQLTGAIQELVHFHELYEELGDSLTQGIARILLREWAA